jgi:hypothetical protein
MGICHHAIPCSHAHSIEYIERNPVRAGLVQSHEEWKWSSAYARIKEQGVIPDSVDIPIYMK